MVQEERQASEWYYYHRFGPQPLTLSGVLKWASFIPGLSLISSSALTVLDIRNGNYSMALLDASGAIPFGKEARVAIKGISELDKAVTDANRVTKSTRKSGSLTWDLQRFAGKGSNNVKPNPIADGSHTVFTRDGGGRITHYQTYYPQSNPLNSNSWENGIRYDATGGRHYYKATREWVNTRHVHDPFTPGGEFGLHFHMKDLYDGRPWYVLAMVVTGLVQQSVRWELGT